MTQKQNLVKLLAKVEVGEMPMDGVLQRILWPNDSHNRHNCRYAYHGSLDAALSLHKAVLPKLGWEVCERSRYPNLMPSRFNHKYLAQVGWGKVVYGDNDNPARAWLIAIIKALIAECDQ